MLLLYPTVFAGSGRTARAGYALVVIGLVVPGIVDIITVGLSPPLLMPLVGFGLILSGSGNRGRSPAHLPLFSIMQRIGLLLIFALAWGVAIPQELSDRVDGYRIFGLTAYFLAGLGWIWLGVTMRQYKSAPRAKPASQGRIAVKK